MRALRHVGIFAACTLALTSASWNATAQGKSKAAASRLDPAKLKAELESRDESRMLAALKHVADAGDAGKPVAPHVEALVRRGASVEVLTLALNVLAGLKQPSSSAAIAPYYRHRVPEVRLAATKALLQTGGPAGIKALRAALRSPDARVRGMAASGLGSLNASEALPDLFAALNHNVGEAATSIGQLCKPVECEKLAGYLGSFPSTWSPADSIRSCSDPRRKCRRNRRSVSSVACESWGRRMRATTWRTLPSVGRRTGANV